MMPWRVFFWGIFSLLGVWLQSLIPGVDFLAPGFILCVQEERWPVTVWLAVLWLFIQEGTGSLAFGSGILWYGALAGLYYFGHWLFEARNFLFMFILGICLGLLHFLLTYVMAYLNDWTIITERVALECLLQALIFPVEWGLMFLLYNHLPEDANAL